MLMLIAVAMNYWYGERGPALLSLTLAFPCMCYLPVEPHESVHIASSDIAYFITCLSLAGLIWWFSTVRRIEADLRERRDKLKVEVKERSAGEPGLHPILPKLWREASEIL